MADTKEPQKRSDGRFVSGDPRANPGGRPRLREDVKSMLLEATPLAARRAIEALDAERPVVVGNGASATMEMVPDHDVRLKAYHAIMDRLHGRPAQEITGGDGGPLISAIVPDMIESMRKLVEDK